MNRNATLANKKCRRHRELIFWLPLGLISLFYLLTSPNYSPSNKTNNNNNTSSASINSVGVVANNSNSTALSTITTETTTTSSPVEVKLGYKLEMNTTITNSYGDRCKVLRYSAHGGDYEDSILHPVTTSRWAQLLSNHEKSDDWIRAFTNLLANAPMNAFFFETQGVTIATSQHTPFEFVLVESSYLYQFADAHQDPNTFESRFQECNNNSNNNNNNNESSSQEVEMNGCVFSSLGGDSILIAPMQMESADDTTTTTTTTTTTNTNANANNTYGHLAAFVRRASSDQVIQFWKLVMRTFVARLESEDPNRVWLSTDGTGVAWLHVRLDPKPKYYDYMPYVIGDED